MRYLSDEDSDLTTDMMHGMRSAYPGLFIHPTKYIVLLNRERSHRVALLAGCGSGHEPYGSGFVGENMLTGFVSGPIFDSPSIANITSAIVHLAEWNQGGVLLILVNTTSCKLSFGLAAERAMAKGIQVEKLLILDDCSMPDTPLPDKPESLITRRTLSGSVIYFKILGGLASSGASMEDLLWEERLVKARTASASVCYTACTLPGKKRPRFELSWGHVSLGVGTNGEEGGEFTFKFRPIQEIIRILIERLLPRCLLFDKGSVAVVVNNLGSLTNMESYLIANYASSELASKGIRTARMYVGAVLTSLEMKGFTLSLTNVTEKESWLRLLDLETEAFAWPGTRLSTPTDTPSNWEFVHDVPDIMEICGKELDHGDINDLKNSILSVCKALMNHKDGLNRLCIGITVKLGTEMQRFAEATLGKMKESCAFLQTLPNAFLTLSSLAEQTMSTSAAGSIYSLLLIGAANGAAGTWPDIWESAVATLSNYTSHKIGHRSLLDALIPACGVFRRLQARDGPQSWRHALKAAVEASEEACADTKTMVSKARMSPFFEQTAGREEAGARAVAVILRAVYTALCPDLEQPGLRRRSRRISSITYPRDLEESQSSRVNK